MSAVTAATHPAPRRVAVSRPSVATRAVPKGAPRVRYVIASLIGIFSILALQLMLSIALGNGAYAIQDLERQLAERNRDLSIVSEEIGAMQDPQTLATLAVSLGMVDDGDPSYLRLSDASVLGSGQPAEAGTTTIVPIVAGETDDSVATVASTIATQQGSDGESLPTFATVDEDTSGVSATPTTLEGVDALVPAATPVTPPAKNFGGDLPAPTTH